MNEAAEEFYLPQEGNRFFSTTATVGPWNPALQHGGPPAALIGRALERLPGRPGVRIARISVEILGPIPLDTLALAAEVVRPGRSVEMLTASASAGDRAVLRATAWRIATEEGRSPSIGLDAPPPPLPEAQPQVFFAGVERFPYGDAMEWRFVEGGYDQLGPATVWTRCRIPLVRGEETSPLCRLLAMVDSANGVSAELPFWRFTFVPVDLNLVLHRHPRGEWVGMTARTVVEKDGVGMTQTRLFDREGYLGSSLHTLYVAPR
ncbi:MAG: thioesterase family protein [Myxococcales bacterium]